MILSDADIRRRLAEGELTVEPLADPELQIQPASVDLRLGRTFLEFQHTNIASIHPDSEREIDEYVSETIVDADEEFILHPDDFVLGTTKERVEIPPDLIAHVEGRSSLGRLAVVVHASLPYQEEVFLWTPAEGFGFYEIGAIVENERPARAVSFDPQTLTVGTYRVTDYITNPTKRIYRVQLQSGRAVTVTKDHNLFTLDNYGGVTRIPSEDAEGTHVMVPGTLPRSPTESETLDLHDLVGATETTVPATATATHGADADDRDVVPDGAGQVSRQTVSTPTSPPTPTPTLQTALADAERSQRTGATVAGGTNAAGELALTPAFGWMLGVYTAAGSTRRNQIELSTPDRALLEQFVDFFRASAVGTEVCWRETDRPTVTIWSPPWSRLLQAMAGTTGRKTLPAHAFDWPAPVVAALLEGLLDGNGCRRDTRDTLYTAAPEVADRAAYLGTRLGLLASVHSPGERLTQHPTGADERSGAPWAVTFRDGADERRPIPAPGALLGRYRQRAEMQTRGVAERLSDASRSRISRIEDGACETVTRETLRRLRDAFRDAGVTTTRLDQILHDQVRFEKVTTVERTDRTEPTYDLEVQPGGRAIENFVAGRGGIFLSNTAGLCDPGYQGQITLELSNLGAAPVALAPDMRISQLTFTELTSPAERPYGEERGSKYQGQEGPQASRIGGDREFGGDQ